VALAGERVAALESLPGTRVEANGLSFHVVDEGEGTPVLLLHGFPDSSWMWRNQIPALVEAGYRVIAPDLRGFGESDKPQDPKAYAMQTLVTDVVGILDALGVERSHVVGHDWGAALAWSYAAFFPGKVERLTAIAVGHPKAFFRALTRTSQGLRSWYMLFFQIPRFSESVLSRNDFAAFRRMFRSVPDMEQYVQALSRPGALTAALNWYRANARPTQGTPDVPNVVAPTLGVWGTRDFALTERQMTSSAEFVEGPFRYERIEAGHWLMLQKPEELNRILLEWLA
jgi:pimeloyl-ACP methyl ester carboxylesterase